MLVSGRISANAKDYHVFMEYYVGWTFFGIKVLCL
jgi:hypothetical protein